MKDRSMAVGMSLGLRAATGQPGARYHPAKLPEESSIAPVGINADDFAQPTSRGVCGVGPWLFPSLQARGWMRDTSPAELAKGAAIIRGILDQFHAMLVRMTQRPGARLFIAETRGALDPANGWANELHPTANGARILARRFKRAIDAALA